ncbi:MAG: IPTL-CTERM sorting domain-containing protein [Phycisphaerae bacterium]
MTCMKSGNWFAVTVAAAASIAFGGAIHSADAQGRSPDRKAGAGATPPSATSVRPARAPEPPRPRPDGILVGQNACCCPDGTCIDLPLQQDCIDLGCGPQPGAFCVDNPCGGALCPPGAVGDCCTGLAAPGCGNTACCDCVCSFDTFCCNNTWDTICAGEACSACAAVCDCCPPPAVCGNNITEPGEQCDGTDDAACPGLCLPNCTCPAPVCGNNVTEAGEQCDGTDDAACPGQCLPNCTCPQPVCGNNITEPGEDCDGTDDAACPGQCQPDCTCPPDGAIPTVSEWGMIVMAILLLGAGGVLAVRRRGSAAAGA